MSKSYWFRSVCGGLDSLMDRTVLQLFGVKQELLGPNVSRWPVYADIAVMGLEYALCTILQSPNYSTVRRGERDI